MGLPKRPRPQGMVLPVARMVAYVMVGWVVISIAKLFIGDPLTIYLDATHNELLKTVSSILSLAVHAAVGAAVLHALWGLVLVDNRGDIARRMELVRLYDSNWEVKRPSSPQPLPHAPQAHTGPQADVAECTEIMRVGSKSFFLASWLLPEWVREPALALYSFCRKADDDIDEGDELGAEARLEHLQKRLEDSYAGFPAQNCVDRSFSAVVRAFDIPKELPVALLDGFRWDLDKRKYNTYSDVVGYSARVAAAVGGMMTVLMGGSCSNTYARAFDLGVAMQLTNIARDVGEDARNGRVYLPAEWLREEGLDQEELVRNPEFTPALGKVVRRLLGRADELYARADAGISQLPRSCRVAIRAARLIYSDIGIKLEGMGYDSVSRRAVVSKRRKVYLAMHAALELVRPPRGAVTDPVVPECQFLLDAVLKHCTEPAQMSSKV